MGLPKVRGGVKDPLGKHRKRLAERQVLSAGLQVAQRTFDLAGGCQRNIGGREWVEGAFRKGNGLRSYWLCVRLRLGALV